MKEEQLFDPMVAYLKKEGYSILEQHRGHEHGTDIVAAKDDYKFWLELKGDSKAYDVDFGTLVYQIMKKMQGLSSDKYGLVVSENYRKLAARCKFPLVKLKICVYIVNESGVELLY